MFALGVDLGTSNTVAVVRWPDGRTRPLLFDGQPLMPSGVYLDADDRLHAGRDAQRLAETDPSRYEPNPKRHVDEPAVLLGDREVPTVDLLAALLGAVARAAVEAAGHLPPAVLTFPASWGRSRRDVLAAAAVRAGWPPPRLTPEPVAAARYFADVLRRPVPVGASLAVFDFGGGTLDVAVVRNDGGRFAVLGSGGLHELGGLDLDAALVEHLGGLLRRSAPQAWQRLTAPASAVDQRDRRRFWDDVRGAKEMLSRTASAPVAVPGVDQAVHLTREELERVVNALLRRGVMETASVVAGCGLRPADLAGLFLVGGSSRVPLVARLLHSELGVAPTVLEQPELPVAEGALAELVPAPQPAPTQPAPTVPAQAMPAAARATAPVSATPVSPVPVSPEPTPLTVTPTATETPRRRYPVKWIAAAAAVGVLAVVAGAYAFFRDGVAEVAFDSLTQVGTVHMGGGASTSGGAFSHVVGDRVYVAWQEKEKLELIAADAANGKEKWRNAVNGSSDRWAGIVALPGVVVVSAHHYSSSEPRTMYVHDADDGQELWHRDIYGMDSRLYFDDVVVLADRKAGELRGLDLRSGREKWHVAFPKAQFGLGSTTVLSVSTDADLRGPAHFDGNGFAPDRADDKRVVLIGVDESAYVYDAASGKLLKKRGNVGKPDWWYLAHGGKLYVAPDDKGYRVEVYDLDSLGEPRRVYLTTDSKRAMTDMEVCGKDRICVLDEADLSDKTAQVHAIDTAAAREVWHKDVPNATRVLPFGDRVMVGRPSSGQFSVVFDADGKEVFRREMAAGRVNGGSALLFSRPPVAFGSDTNLTGLSVATARYQELGEAADIRGDSCSWSETVLVCANDKDFVIWRFASG